MSFGYQQFNYGSALAFALGVVVFIGSYLFMFATRGKNGLLK